MYCIRQRNIAFIKFISIICSKQLCKEVFYRYKITRNNRKFEVTQLLLYVKKKKITKEMHLDTVYVLHTYTFH